MADMRAEVTEVIVSHFKMQPGQVPEELSSDTIDAWDSLGHMTLIEELEKRLAMPFSEKESVIMLNLDAICDVVRSKNSEES